MKALNRAFYTTIFIGFFLFISQLSFSQTSISGIINSYAAVDSVLPTKDSVLVEDGSLFFANDTVMIYQAKGADVYTDTTALEHNFGNVITNEDFNNAGKYELILVQEVKGDTVILKATLVNNYNVSDSVQLIRVPSYKNARVDGEVTCEPWDGSKGGVVVIMVGDTLYLDDHIDVSAKGFRGATPFSYDISTHGSNCASEDSALYRSYYFDENTLEVSAGYKGEGIAKFDPVYRKGLGRWANGGGGGNGRFSGGGGGGNYSQGGDGGQEDTTVCNTPDYTGEYWKGLGGLDGAGLGFRGVDFTINDSTLYLGGGGGSGTYISGYTASTGGAGGGIVIIIAKAIKSNGHSIITTGETVQDIATASAGGGGAGGSVVFDIESVVGDVKVNVSGGRGGHAQYDGQSGPGGGGAGGVILWNGSSTPSNVDENVQGGAAGNVAELLPADIRNEASPGELGGQLFNVDPPLTGFLFNWISDDQVICKNTAPRIISGTQPRGGNGSFTYQWQIKNDTTSGVFEDIPGATGKDYQPPVLTDTCSFKRIVTSGSIEDKGNNIEIIVQDPISNNSLVDAVDYMTCIGNEADTVKGTTIIPNSGGDNIEYNYIWEQRTDEGAWSSISLLNDTVCLPGTVLDTTFVRRVVSSGACYDTTASQKITGLPSIGNNDIGPDQEICYGDNAQELSSAAITGGLGAGTYNYKWIRSVDSTTWTDTITGVTSANYNPGQLFDTTYYKRKVTSFDCEDISNITTIDVLELIGSNDITNEMHIFTCYGTEPELLVGSSPSGGDFTYNFQWMDSVAGGSFNPIADATNKDYQPEALTDTTYFMRKVVSSACEDISDFVKVGIWELPKASILNDIDTVCSDTPIDLNFWFAQDSGKYPVNLYYNDGNSGLFEATVNNTGAFTDENIPSTRNEKQDFVYTIDSIVDQNGCYAVSKEGTTTYTVYGIPTANIGPDHQVCGLSELIKADNIYGTGAWSYVAGSVTPEFSNLTKDSTTFTVDTAGIYQVIWEKTSWNCKDVDTLELTMYNDVQNVRILSPDSIPAKKTAVDTIVYNKPELDVRGAYDNYNFESFIQQTWSADVAAVRIDNASEKEATYRWADDGQLKNFNLLWTVQKGICPVVELTRSVDVRDFIFKPNGFTPNGDGVNDKLIFEGLKESDQNELIIFNRWGTRVYEESNFTNEVGWDGTTTKGEELPEDTYYYILKTRRDILKGFIVLKRY